MSQHVMGSPAKRKKSDHAPVAPALLSPAPQAVLSTETPKSFDFGFSVENTPSLAITELAVPSSKDWNFGTGGIHGVTDHIFSPPPSMRPSAPITLGLQRGIAASDDISAYSPLIGGYSLMDNETSSHLQRTRDALSNRLDDLSRGHHTNSNPSLLSLSSGSNAAPYEAIALGASSSGMMKPVSENVPVTTPPGTVHEDPFVQVDKPTGLIVTPSKKDRHRNIAQELSEEGTTSSQGSRLDGLLAAAKQFPERAITPVSAHSPVSGAHRKKVAKVKSPGRSLSQSKEGPVASVIRSGPLGSGEGVGLSLFGQVQRGSITSSQDTTPVSSMLNSDMLQLDLSRHSDKKSVTCNCKKSRCLKMYCDCFRLTEYCKSGCNCLECANSPQCESQRQHAIKSITDRNPEAFKPRVVEDSANNKGHLTGCHCRKSACLKKYCECFTAKVACTERCRCVDCKNVLGLYSGGRGGTNSNANSQDGFLTGGSSSAAPPSTLSAPSLATTSAQVQAGSLNPTSSAAVRKTPSFALSNIDHDRQRGIDSLASGVLAEERLTLSGETSLFQSAQQQMYSPGRALPRLGGADVDALLSPTKRTNFAPSSPFLSPSRSVGADPDCKVRPPAAGAMGASLGVESSHVFKKKALSQIFNRDAVTTPAASSAAPPTSLLLDLGSILEAPASPARPSSGTVDSVMSPTRLLEFASLCEERAPK